MEDRRIKLSLLEWQGLSGALSGDLANRWDGVLWRAGESEKSCDRCAVGDSPQRGEMFI